MAKILHSATFTVQLVERDGITRLEAHASSDEIPDGEFDPAKEVSMATAVVATCVAHLSTIIELTCREFNIDIPDGAHMDKMSAEEVIRD